MEQICGMTIGQMVLKVFEYYEANRDVIDRVEEWPALTGLTLDELEQMELHEVVELIKSMRGY